MGCYPEGNPWVPSLCTPSALRKPSFFSGASPCSDLQKLASTIVFFFSFFLLFFWWVTFFACPLCLRHFHALPPLPSRAPVPLRGELLGVASALVFASVAQFLWLLPRGHPLTPGSGGQRGLCSSVPWNCTIRDSSWQASTPPPPTLHRQQ